MAGSVLAAVGIGSNLDDPEAQVRSALQTLASLPESRLIAASSLYHSPPLGPQDQPDYINAVALLETKLGPHALLDALQGVEQAHHRVRGRHWGPRTLDLDLLTFGPACIADARLTVPHPGLALRAFVVFPLAEIAPELEIPGLPTPASLRECMNEAGIVRLTQPADRV
ncbi:MAG: hypothetical protein RL434_2989 [Pseudomonadota bacterium]|jgi:2-amino-4-hydroxy-6-hydroxymethyldihydropteridine diphosphokinase